MKLAGIIKKPKLFHRNPLGKHQILLMQILEIKVLKGPNYWSVRRAKLIQMKLDLEEKENMPTNKIPGFRERLEKLLPSLYEHRCSEGVPGGFFHRVEEGTWMGHVIEHIAWKFKRWREWIPVLEEQGHRRGKRRCLLCGVQLYRRGCRCICGKSFCKNCKGIDRGQDYDLADDIQNMRVIREDTRMGPSTGCIVEEAAKRGIPFIRLNKQSLVQLGYGVNQKRIRATIASTTSNIAVDIACNKDETKMLLEAAEIPVPKGTVIRTEEGLKEAVEKYGYPLVIKPIDGNHGKGNTTNINSWEVAVKALAAAAEYSRSVIVEKFITGFDFRCLVINYKFVCAALRTPASVVGMVFMI